MIRALAVLLPLLLPPAAVAQEPPPPSFAQLAGPPGCLIAPEHFEDQADCGPAPALDGSTAVALTPDGAQVAVVGSRSADEGSDGVAIFKRDPQSGGLSFASCISDDGGDGRDGSEGTCSDGDALAGASQIAFSPDGAFAYVASARASGVSWFTRDPATGALTQAGCIKEAIHAGERCTQGIALAGARAVAVSPDGSHVYVAAERSGALTVFRRDATTGALTLQSCVSQTGSDGACTRAPGLRAPFQLQATADGTDLYVLGGLALTTLTVTTTGDLAWKGCLLTLAPPGGPCTQLPLLKDPQDAVLALDGRNLLVENDADDLISLARDPGTGALSVQQCFRALSEDPPEADDPARDCTQASWEDAVRIAMSADGRAAYVSGFDQVVAYQRDRETGRLTEVGCVSGELGGCAALRAGGSPTAIAASADARNLYMATDFSELISLQLTVAITSARSSGDGTVRVGLSCPAARREGCAGRLTGARAARFRLAAGRSHSFRVQLTTRQRTHLRRHRRVALALRANVAGIAATTRRVTVRG
jgi:6-phosphogluconolactonase (cycloisomerase 2 family)